MNRIGRGAARAALVLLTSGLAACGSDSSGPPKAGPPTSLAVIAGGSQQGKSGEPLPQPLIVKATDKDGRPVTKAPVTFTVTTGGGTLSATIDTTDSDGQASVTWTMGSLLGSARVEARVAGLLLPAVFNATVAAGPPTAVERVSPLIGNSAAGFDAPDSVAVRVVDRFGHPIAGAQVSFIVAGGGGSVSHAAKQTGSDGVARTAWRLGTSGAQSLRATAGTFETTLTANAVACAETQMAVGDVLSLIPGAPACVVMNGSAQRFLVTVANSSRTASSVTSFRFRGAGPAPLTMSATSPTPPAVPAQSPAYAATVAQQQGHGRAHSEIMRANLELFGRLAPARQLQMNQLRAAGKLLVQTAPPPNVGDVLTVRIPSFQNLCSVTLAKQIGARVVYVGTHTVVLEDTAATVRGQVDAAYEAVGQEFDNVMWPILTGNFGNPLAMDAQLDNNGLIFMVLSPHINTIQGGTVAGFVSGGDFFPTAGPSGQTCAASNFGEYFYARVPTSTASGFDSDNSTTTADEWLRLTRTVIIHEVKHIASYAEKFASPDIVTSSFFNADIWLEEASAMIAEELWARTIFGYAFKGNVDYDASIFCEVRPTVAACQPTRPVSMFDHYFWLAQFAENPEIRSPIDSPAQDPSVYGSGWLFVRWLLDQYATSESAFLGAITLETQRPGVENIEARTSRSFTELIADWATAFALDDYPGLTASGQKHQILSWNVRDIYRRLNMDFSNQGFFLQQFPLRTRSAGFGKFLIDISSLRGGGMAVFEISGAQTANQLFEFKGFSGTELPAELRISIARVQ